MKHQLIEITPELSYFPEAFRSCNVYLLTCLDCAVLFDPSISPDKVISGRSITKLIATHAHYDHIGSVNVWKQEVPDRPFLMHPGDIPMLDDSSANASVFFGRPGAFAHPDHELSDEEVIKIDREYSIRVLNTPGHTMGSSCFIIYRQVGHEPKPVALITGDTLFDCGWGRTDFITGDDTLMRRSLERLYRVLIDMPPNLPVCPGHAGLTTAEEACRFLRMMRFTG